MTSPIAPLSPTLTIDLREVAVAGRQTVAVIDLDHFAVAAAPAGGGRPCRCGRVDRVAGVAAEIESGVHAPARAEWIDAHAEREAVSISPFTGLRTGTGSERPA